MAALAGTHHAALSVSDLEVSARWYREVLGLEETFRQESEVPKMVVMRFAGLRHTVGLVEHKHPGVGFSAQNVGLDHLAFSVASAEELAAWPVRLDEWGVSYSGPSETPFGGMLNFEDPDGIALALFWERGEAPA
ncbi:MAG TPA: VOC family protein [Acidimicrobiales bacterium]|nr:VOC family protein [Acidimicrobiales bacterium]